MTASTLNRTPTQRRPAWANIVATLFCIAANLLNTATAAQLSNAPATTDTTSDFLHSALENLSIPPVEAWVTVGNNEYAIYDTETEQLIAYMAMYSELALNDGMGGGMGSSAGTNLTNGSGYGAAMLNSQTTQTPVTEGTKTASGGGAGGSSKTSGTSGNATAAKASEASPETGTPVAAATKEEPDTLAPEQTTISPSSDPNSENLIAQQPEQENDVDPIVATNPTNTIIGPDNNLFLLPDGDVIVSNDIESSEFVTSAKAEESFETVAAVPLAHSFWLLLAALPMLRRKP